MTGITSSLATYSGQNAAWQLIDLSSAITAYAGATARVVFRYQSGANFRGDLQLDAISVGPNTYGFESGVDSFQTSTTADGATSSYNSVTSFQALATGTTNGYWNRDTGNTPSSGTGNLGAYAGSYFVYAEATGSGSGYPNKYFWLRGPEVVLEASNPTLGFALGREGSDMGTLDVYLDITVDPAVPVDVDAEGLSATSALGSPTVSGAASTGVTGVQGLVHVGTVHVGLGQTILSTGVESSGEVGSVTQNLGTTVYFQGWGRGGWGELGFGEGNLGVQATGAVGTVGFIFGATVNATGVQGTTVLGNTTVEADGAVETLGNAATGELGSVVVSIGVDISVTGLEAISALGIAEVDLQLDVPVTGVLGTTALGTNTVIADANVALTGEQATAQLGSVTVLLSQRILATGVQAIASLGQEQVTADANALVTGVQATGQVGTVLVWGEIVPNQNPDWVDVDDSQTPEWGEINASQTPNWTDIAA